MILMIPALRSLLDYDVWGLREPGSKIYLVLVISFRAYREGRLLERAGGRAGRTKSFD
jgi:hypothetical protein